MSASTIRSALGILQDEPGDERAWSELHQALGFTPGANEPGQADVAGTDLQELLEAARRAHEMRREYQAVVQLLEIETTLTTGDRQAELVAEMARVLDEELLDDARSIDAYRKLLILRPGDATAEEGIERGEAKRAKWKDLAQRYYAESKSAGDPAFKSSLLVSAAEIAYRYGRPDVEAREKETESQRSLGKKKKKEKKEGKDPRRELLERIVNLLREAMTLDGKNRRASMLLERIFRDEERWPELVQLLEAIGTDAHAKEDRLAALMRLARVHKKKLGDADRAVAAYERVLDLAPGHQEATSALVDYYTERQLWDHLVSLYEGQLAGGGVRAGQEVGIIFQIAMVHWKMRHKPEAAEPYFERLRKLEPAHPGMIQFLREWCVGRGDQARLVQVLSDAQRAMPDGPERSQLSSELAQLAEVGANAQKAIEQWRGVLRTDPTNKEAREALKRLFRQTGAYNHLADVLRSELERVAVDDAATRVPMLREIAEIYRNHVKSESALVAVLSQLIALDPHDADAVRELARVYETLGRWRDLLTTQMRLAELEANAGAKAELYRAIARRWLDQFSNVQNAVEAYEKLRESLPDDVEAMNKLKELYTKRRAYRQLFELSEAEASRATGAERRAIWMEMAKLASDRLDRGADASRLYKLVLAEDPTDAAALDALEKQAERDKDFVTVAEALERRAESTEDPNARLVVLQKLGQVYSDRLQDVPSALRTWRRVLALAPGHAKALRVVRESYLAMGDYDGLTALYGENQDWEGLVEVLGGVADRAEDTQTKVDLSMRSAAILEDKIGAPERAFRSYERVLSVRPDDRRAAAALVPIYESEEKWSRLPALYEVLLQHATDDVERRGLYKKLAVVAGHKLSDRQSAFGYARKAFDLAPAEPGAIRDLEQWAKASGDWAGFVAAIEKRLASRDTSPEERRDLRLRLAETSVTQAGRTDDAIGSYKQLIEENEADEDAIAALDRLLRASPDHQDNLRWLFELRARRAADVAARFAILSEWALLEEEAFGAPLRAIDVHRRILKESPDSIPSLRALARLLVAAGDAEGAATVLAHERDLEEGGSRVAREIDLARLYMGPLHRPTEAMAAAKRALALSPNDPAVIAVIEDLLPLSETRAVAAVILEQAYGVLGAFGKQAEVLGVMIATAASKSDRLELYGRLADVKGKQNDNVGAFEVVVRAATEYPGELALWDRLSVLANKTHRTAQFVEAITLAVPEKGDSGLPLAVELDLAERAATLYDEMLGEIDRATPYLERILTRDPSNERAFLRLKQILTTRERWSELEALYEKVIAATEDAGRRADLLNEVALIAEEITGDSERAIGYYERILELEPANDQAIFALDKLYASHDRHDKQAALLERRIQLAGGSDTGSLKLRLGTILATRLGDPKGALNYLEDVVLADSSVREARDLVEKSLAIPELRQRAAIILEGVYADRDEMRDLVRVLEVRLEFVADDVERRELLRRIAELKDERLTDDRGAFEAYGKLLPLSPGDVEARQRYLEIATRLARENDAADVLLVAAKNAETPQPRAELLGDVAKIYEGTDQADRAEAIHRQVLELAPDDPSIALPATRALERIYSAHGKNRELADVLRAQVRLEEAVEIRRELYARLGTLCEESLHDDAASIAAWKARLDDDPADAEALASLDRLYARTKDHRALVEILRARERSAEDAAARKGFMVRAAETLGGPLADVTEAILAYRAILDDFGADVEVLRPLASLYASAERWRDLAETLEAELALVTTEAERVALLVRLGDVRRQRLTESTEALDAYRQALVLDAENADARTALEAMLVEPDTQREAAELLRPLYEAASQFDKLVRVLEIQVEHAGDPVLRMELLARAVAVSDGPLGDPRRAFGYAARGLRDAALEPSLPEWVNRAERLVDGTGQWEELATLYREVSPEVADEERRVTLLTRVAEIARARLASPATAKEYYRKVLELVPDDASALLALEELYLEGAEHHERVEILRRRAELADSDVAKREILYKLAVACDEALGDRDRAIAVYEEVLELGLDAPAIAALTRLYASAGRFADLSALHERELGDSATSAARKAELHHALGRLYERDLGDMDRAFDEYGGALGEDGEHAPTIAVLEALMAEPAHAGRAAEMLEAVYLSRLDWRKVMHALGARLSASEDPEERRGLLRRLAKLHEEQEEDYRAALDVFAKLLAEDVTDETTWAELERLARVANAEPRLAEIYRAELEKLTSDEPATARLAYRTAELYEATDVEQALTFYRRAYAFAPEEQQKAFQSIDRLLTQAGRPGERVALYRDALEYRTSPEERVATLLAVARLEEEDLRDDEAAIATCRAVLETDETESRALDTLARLYQRRSRHHDLADLYRRRAEQSALPDDEARWRLLLGGVLDETLGDTNAALDEYQSLVALVSPRDNASGKEAVARLERMLERQEYRARAVELLRPIYDSGDEWTKLVGLVEHRLATTTALHERVAILRDAARLHEERGQNARAAFECLKEAFVLDPDDGDTREELDRLAVATERWDDLADAYEKGIAKIDGIGQRELLEALAKLHDKRRDDPRRALDAWDRLFRTDETDPRPLDEMDQLATLLSDWPSLVRVLAKRAELTNDDEERARLWRRIGEARRDMLDDPQGAIDAYERALELEPESSFTIDNLIDLYEGRNDAARLVDLYRRRVELCGEDDADLKHRLLVDAAHRYEVGLGDRPQAIALLSEALAARPDDLDVLGRLAGLYESEKMWAELGDNLRAQHARETDVARRIALTKRIAGLYAGPLDDDPAALEAYREVLGAGFDEDAAAALTEIGKRRDELRLSAAEVLEPVLRTAERYEALVDVLEMRLRSETDSAARATTLLAIADVTEAKLGDRRRAEDALLRTLAETPESEELHASIARLAESTGREGWERYADTLAERATSIFDTRITATLFVRLGRVAETRLTDLPRAAEAFARAAEQGGDSDEVLTALERIHAATGNTRSLVDVLERRIVITEDKAAQADLLVRLATLQISELGDKVQGLATLRLALEKVPEHEPSRAMVETLLGDDATFEEAFDTLEGVYRATSRGADLGRLYARKVDRAPGARERIRGRLDLARVLEEEGADPVAAQRAVEGALADDVRDETTLGELERLAAKNGAWREAADALAAALEADARASSGVALGSGTTPELWARLGTWRRDHVEDRAGAEQAFLNAESADPDNLEYVRAILDLRVGPGRERDRVTSLRRMSRLEGEPSTKRGLSREAVSIAETVLGDPRLAEEVLGELLADNESDAWALDELTRLREAAGDDATVVTLLLRRAEGEEDGVKALELRHRAAEVAADRLGDKARAVELFEHILEQERRDRRAQARLRGLYDELGRFNQLARLLEVLIDFAEVVGERAELRIELAKLQLDKFQVREDAVDTLRDVLAEDPDHEGAARALGEIYAGAGQNEELADLWANLVGRAAERGDRAMEIARMVALGEIQELKVKDAGAALKTYEGVLERDPEHRVALEAVARLAEGRGAWDAASAALGKLAASESGAQAKATWLRLAQAAKELGNEAEIERALGQALAADLGDQDVRDRLIAHRERTNNWGDLATLLVDSADRIRDAHPPYEPPPVAPAAAPRTSLAPGGGSLPPGGSLAPQATAPAHVQAQVKLLRRAAEVHIAERNAPAEGVAILERASALVPQDRELLTMLGDAYTAAGRGRDAATVLERIIASFGNKRTKEVSVYHHKLGKALAALGDRDLALAQLDMAFRVDPGSVEVLRDLGVLALEANDLERAQKTFRALLLQRLDDKSGITKGEVFCYLGEISMKQGDKPKAVQMLERAVENEPTLARAKAMLLDLKG